MTKSKSRWRSLFLEAKQRYTHARRISFIELFHSQSHLLVLAEEIDERVCGLRISFTDPQHEWRTNLWMRRLHERYVFLLIRSPSRFSTRSAEEKVSKRRPIVIAISVACHSSAGFLWYRLFSATILYREDVAFVPLSKYYKVN